MSTYADMHDILTSAAALARSLPDPVTVTIEGDAGTATMLPIEALADFADLAPGEGFVIHSINFTEKEK